MADINRKHSTHDIEEIAKRLGAEDPAVDRVSATAVRVRVRAPTRAGAQEQLGKKIAKQTGLSVEVIER